MTRSIHFIGNERGTVLILVLVALVVVFGVAALVIDGGLFFVTRGLLANAADAAALAGVQFLPDDPEAAVDAARQFAHENGVGAKEVNVSVGTDGKTIAVRAERKMSFIFAPVLGFTNILVSAQAKARVGGVKAVIGVVPLGMPEQQLEYKRLYTLKVGGGAGEHGNFGALALGGEGSHNYQNGLANGYQQWLRIGDLIESEPGNMSGPTVQAVEHRIMGHGTCNFDDHCQACPRIVFLPVYRVSGELQGRDTVEVVGFAAFFLENATGQGKDCYVKGYFIKKLTSMAQGFDGLDFGLRVAKLVE